MSRRSVAGSRAGRPSPVAAAGNGAGARPKTSDRVGLRDVAFEKIRSLIVAGELEPGQRLIEESLGQQLGMSRNPVRESLKMLEREGFVTMEPFRGALVSRLGREAALEVFELREILDPYAARKAAQQATAEDVELLRTILSEGHDHIERGELGPVSVINSRFHGEIHRMAGNQELQRSLDHLRLKVEWMFQGYAATRSADAWDEHERMLDAIAGHDGTTAARVARTHVRNSKRAYDALLDA